MSYQYETTAGLNKLLVEPTNVFSRKRLCLHCSTSTVECKANAHSTEAVSTDRVNSKILTIHIILPLYCLYIQDHKSLFVLFVLSSFVQQTQG